MFTLRARSATAAASVKKILEVTYRGKNIRQILDLTVAEALEFFKDTKEVIQCARSARAPSVWNMSASASR